MENFCDGLLQQELLQQAIHAGTVDYIDSYLNHRESVLHSLNGDGFTWHNSFVRGISSLLARQGRRNGLAWFAKRKEWEGLEVIGDYVAFTPQKGQNRLAARFSNNRYLLLPVTGSICHNVLTMCSMGQMRQEFCLNQHEAIPRDPNWSFENAMGQQAQPNHQMRLLNADEIRALIVTQIYGPGKNRIKVSLGIPDGQFNAETGQACLHESQEVLDEDIYTFLSAHAKRAKRSRPAANTPIEIKVGRKKREGVSVSSVVKSG